LKFRALVAAALAAAVSPALAQGFGQDGGQGSRNGRGGTPGEFDFYVLALSWSPAYCEGQGSRRDGDGQCRPGRGLGLIGASWGVEFCVHGLDRNFAFAYATACREARP